jgi:fermentation-respiration switch protein FrsA (DUF1100 family)
MSRVLRKIAAALLVTGVAIYLLLLGALFFYQRDMLYHPNPRVGDPGGSVAPEMRAVRVNTADGLRPLAWYAPPPRSDRPVIVYFHGNGGTVAGRAPRARMFLDAGYGVLLAGYRYNAGGGGSPSEEGLIADGRAAVAYLRAQGIPERRIVLYGESLGTGVAVAVAAEYPVAALVLDMPYSSIADVAQETYWFFPVRWLVLDTFDSRSRIGAVHAPILMFHGEDDTLIPVRFARRLYEAAPAPKEGHFIPGGTHGNLYRLGAGKLVLDFLERRVVRAARPADAG